MDTISWPTSGRAFTQIQFDEGIELDVEIAVARAGNVSTRQLPGWRWLATIGVPLDITQYREDRQQLEATLMRLRGGANRLAMYNPAKPAPLGTLRGAPLVKTAISKGATSVVLKSANGTIKRGDLFGVGGQRVMAVADASLVGSEVTLTFEPPARQAVGVDTAVVWDRPTSLFIPTSPRLLLPYTGHTFGPFSIELIEAWT